jgi:hypothetical protein
MEQSPAWETLLVLACPYLGHGCASDSITTENKKPTYQLANLKISVDHQVETVV